MKFFPGKFSPIKQHPRRPAVTPTNGCDCTYEVYDCGCCVHMEIDQIDLNDTGTVISKRITNLQIAPEFTHLLTVLSISIHLFKVQFK